MSNKEPTIAYGNEIQLDKDKKTGKEVWVKLSTAFKDKQLKELKGAPLSVFICYALHSNENGYTWVGDKTVKKETGYSTTSKIRKKLIEKGYLYQARLRNEENQVKDYIYRIFQPIERNKEFKIRGESLYTLDKENPCIEVRSKQGGDGGDIKQEPSNTNKEEPNTMDSDESNLTGEQINELIGLFEPVNPTYEKLFNMTTQRKAVKELVDKFGYEEIKQLVEILEDINGEEYAPTITTPHQLQSKMGKLKSFFERRKKDKDNVAFIS